MSKKANAPEEISEAKIRQAIWMMKQKKTKKSICEHLGISYNTKRLDN
jgi:DNA-binding CsgD family transcriptional regulator